MEHLTAILSVNRDGVVGRSGLQPWRLRSQLRFFREQTMDSVVIVGRRTFGSLGHGCLPRRHNIVLTHRPDDLPPEAVAAADLRDALLQAVRAPAEYKGCFVIGGASLFDQFAPYVDRYLITLVDQEVPDGDSFFNQEPLGDPDAWDLNPLTSGRASDEDDAAFSIFEVVSRHPEQFIQRRLALLVPPAPVEAAPVPAKVARLRPKPRRYGRRVTARSAQISA